MKSHRRPIRRLAIGLVALGASSGERRVGARGSRLLAVGQPGREVGDTPADFPGASHAPAVALNAAQGRRHAADFRASRARVALNAATRSATRRPTSPAPAARPTSRRPRSRSSGPSAPSCATSTRSCRSRSPAPRCSSCSWAPRSSSSACAWSAATRSGARTDLLKGREVGRVDAAHLLGHCGGQRVRSAISRGPARSAGRGCARAVDPDARAGRRPPGRRRRWRRLSPTMTASPGRAPSGLQGVGVDGRGRGLALRSSPETTTASKRSARPRPRTSRAAGTTRRWSRAPSAVLAAQRVEHGGGVLEGLVARPPLLAEALAELGRQLVVLDPLAP